MNLSNLEQMVHDAERKADLVKRAITLRLCPECGSKLIPYVSVEGYFSVERGMEMYCENQRCRKIWSKCIQ